MMHQMVSEFLATGLMCVFGTGVFCNNVLKGSKYRGSGDIFVVTTWGFGITVALFVFGNVSLNPAMVLAQCILGNVPWAQFVPLSLAEVIGGMCGSLLVYLMYKDQFKASEGEVSPTAIRNIFSTAPEIRNLPRNFFAEFVATFIFISSILAMSEIKTAGVVPIAVGILTWAVGMGLGGTTGFAMNIARDWGPRLAHAVLPFKNKATSDWKYALVAPGLGSICGGVGAALFMHLYFNI